MDVEDRRAELRAQLEDLARAELSLRGPDSRDARLKAAEEALRLLQELTRLDPASEAGVESLPLADGAL